MENRPKVKVFTYINPKTWVNHPEFETIKDAIHITSTQSLKEGIIECYKKDDNFKHIFSIKEVITKLFEEWNTPEYKLKKYLELSKIVDEIPPSTINENLKEAFKKNSSELLDTIEYFVWAGLSPDDLNLLHSYLSEKEKLFVEVWSKLEGKDDSYKKLRDKLNGQSISTEFMSILGIEKEKPLVLHGFYYITPQQQKVLSLLQTLGRNIIFFQHYDSRFPNTFGFMNKFISKYQELSKASLDSNSREMYLNSKQQYLDERKQYIVLKQQYLDERKQYIIDSKQQYFDLRQNYLNLTECYLIYTGKYLLETEQYLNSAEKYLISRNHYVTSKDEDLTEIYEDLTIIKNHLNTTFQDLSTVKNNLGLRNEELSLVCEIYEWVIEKYMDLTVIHTNLGLMYQDLNSNNQLSNGQIFLSHFEDKELSLNSPEQQLYKYDTFFEFLHEVIMKHYPPTSEEKQDGTMITTNTDHLDSSTIEKKQNCTIIATNADILNPLLVQYYPSLYSSKRNFLNYPVGQFVLNIHEMYDQGKLILNDKILMSVFSSGWLYDEECNARDLTYQLKQILPFFKGCNEFSEWQERMTLLLNHCDKIENNSWNENEEVISDLLPKLSYCSLKKAEVEKINEFIKVLRDINDSLFLSENSVEKETSLSEYFKKLNLLLNEHNRIDPKKNASFTTEEKEIIEAILGKVKKVCNAYENSNELILYNDLKEALYLFLSGKFDEEENLIKPFIEIDGEIFKEHSNPIYLTGLDENGLPLSRFKTPWPLQDNTFELLSNKYPILGLDILRNKSIKCISRYLLYLGLEFLPQNQLQLSWIANFLDKKDLKQSIYMLIQNMKVSDYYSKEEHSSEESQEYSSNSSIVISEMEINGDESLIYEFCPKRWYYSYVTDSNPTFITDFNHKYLFKLMVEVMRINSVTKKFNELRYGEPNPVNDVNLINDTINIVGAYFPQFTETEKKMLGSRTLDFGFYDDKTRNTYIQNGKNLLYKRGFKYDHKSRCKYCEHIDSCPDGVIEKDTLLDENVKISN